MIPFCSIETHGTTHKGQTTVNYLDMGQKIDRTIKNDTSRLVSKMINHVYLIYHGEISSTQIASFLHLVVIKINRLYTFFPWEVRKKYYETLWFFVTILLAWVDTIWFIFKRDPNHHTYALNDYRIMAEEVLCGWSDQSVWFISCHAL